MIELCECGQSSDPAVHSPLPRPLPWSHGRPCGKVDSSKSRVPTEAQIVRIRSNAARKFWQRRATPSEISRELGR